ncbi:gamma-glutamyltranspeptidase [Dendrothele bispora CBS 962.96]|uniref:Glutathione hydrolase n=1 Tax=Dendrothele bispora (strain CBS 962.96) TaxID=1314807 RepID=A0A4S8MQA8_DENBC|nr:gamma-glutamyltranspeptidase [Dendrothele bispora CBS 962.96]
MEGSKEKALSLSRHPADPPFLPIPAAVRPEVKRPSYFWKFFWVAFTACSFALFTSNAFRSSEHFVPKRNPAYLIKAVHGAVATENHRCSDIGVEVMKEGGNAIDAAIASTLCIGVVNMFSSGIGGGGFLTVRIPPGSPGMSSEVFTVDFREMAPSLSHETMYPPLSNLSQFGGLSVAVPGELRGLEEAHRRWGSLPWKRLVQPSADLAAGWEVDVELSKRIPWFADLMLNNPDWSAIFAPRGVFLKEGEMIYRTNLSKTLSTIANEGPDAFYKGPIADSIIRKVQSTGGILTHEDMENYQVKVYRSLKGTYHDKIIYTPDAPTSGPVLLHMLNLIEKYDFSEHNGLNTHRLVEAMKFGFSARTRISDPAFRNDTSIIKLIPTKAFADAIYANMTDDTTHPAEYYNPEYDVKMDHGTSQVSVVDKSGMAVAVTSTVNLVFGSQVLDPETGVILNDEMDDFSVPGTPNGFGLWPSPYNYPEAGKRPISSTVPSILEHADGSFYMAIGGSGGSLIFGAVFQVLLNMDWGMDLSQAIEFGRLHNQLYPETTLADDIYPKSFLDALIVRGHNLTVLDINRVAAVVNVVMKDEEGVIYAASDSRKNGIASGY